MGIQSIQRIVLSLLVIGSVLLPAAGWGSALQKQPAPDKTIKNKIDGWNQKAEEYLAKGETEDIKNGLKFAFDAETYSKQYSYTEGLYFAYLNQAKLYEKWDKRKYRDDARKYRQLADAELSKLLEKDRETILQRERRISSLSQQNQQKDSVIQEKDTLLTVKELENRQKDVELKIALAEKNLQELQMDKELEEKRFYIIFAILAAIIALAMVYMYFDKNKTNRRLADRNEIIKREKRHSDELLLNILPEELADELKLKGKAEVRHYDVATVMFTDFKDFTRVSEALSPKELVTEIDYCFSEFDRIITKYHIEKIKTIGDAYLCAGGIPTPDEHHPEKIVMAALEIRDFMLALEKERKAAGKMYFQVRIGLHTGPLVAGVVGVKKFAYDIWGDTVNTASRMESSGEPGRVNISGTTYALVKDNFTCTYRGHVPAKNKGEIEMYFVDTVNKL